MEKLLVVLIIAVVLAGCTQMAEKEEDVNVSEENLERATFAGGCFWCMEPPFERMEGVHEVISGFSGGEVENPSYQQVASGETDHVESVQILYDPDKVSYRDLLEVYWRQIDPTDDGGQFVDRGEQYTTAIFYHDEEQKRLAEETKREMNESGIFQGPIVTPIREFEAFYPAEDYHQDYYKKSKVKYKFYRWNSGRDKFLNKHWDGGEEVFEEEEYEKPDETELKERLTEMEYKVTQEDETEQAFENEYWNETREGIYVDVVSGEPLFSSKDKFKSGTGWPSFTKPLEPDNIVKKKDFSLIWPRTEVRSKHADSHLGHVFNDGPEPTGKRYCVNSAALEFIPKEDLEEEGYGEYVGLFE